VGGLSCLIHLFTPIHFYLARIGCLTLGIVLAFLEPLTILPEFRIHSYKVNKKMCGDKNFYIPIFYKIPCRNNTDETSIDHLRRIAEPYMSNTKKHRRD